MLEDELKMEVSIDIWGLLLWPTLDSKELMVSFSSIAGWKVSHRVCQTVIINIIK